jgi:hypothetical protein
MMNHPNGDQIESSPDLSLVNFLEQCWQLEVADALIEESNAEIEAGRSGASLIELDETCQGHPALSQFTIAIWMPLIWLYL